MYTSDRGSQYITQQHTPKHWECRKTTQHVAKMQTELPENGNAVN